MGAFLEKPLHPYSDGLIGALPDLALDKELIPIEGQVPKPSDYVDGCRFRDRCSKAFDPCEGRPELKERNPRQKVACYLY